MEIKQEKESATIKFDNGIELHMIEIEDQINVCNIAGGFEVKKLVAYPSTVNSIILKDK